MLTVISVMNDFTKVQMNKLRITYNNAMRRLFNLHFRCSASEMFANCNIHSLDAMRRTCIQNYIVLFNG